jgi:hypothetical protein
MFANSFVEGRLDRRGEQILEAMQRNETAILHQCCRTHTEQAGAYRFFANEDVTEADMVAASTRHCAQVAKGRQVLVIQDTSSCQFEAHAGQLRRQDRKLGPLEGAGQVGFVVHPVLVVDAEQEFPLGDAHVHLWNRAWEQPDKQTRQYKQQAFATKESARWVTRVEAGKACLTEAAQVTVIADRESDIYEVVATVPDAQTDILLRACQDRRVDAAPGEDGELDRLFARLAASPGQGTYALSVRATLTRQARQAEMEVRFRQVTRPRPATAAKSLPAMVTLWALEARERAVTVPVGETPILWRLLTTHPIQPIETAFRLIRWYHLRWLIEELFRGLKQQGLNVEASQLETGQALRKLWVMALLAAMPILQLTLERDGHTGLEAQLVFSAEELQYQAQLNPTLEGKTGRQQNPFAPRTLAWSAWMIARLGGWKGYRSQSPAGYITMKRGMERFAQGFLGWRLGHPRKLYSFSQQANSGQEKDVCKE